MDPLVNVKKKKDVKWKQENPEFRKKPYIWYYKGEEKTRSSMSTRERGERGDLNYVFHKVGKCGDVTHRSWGLDSNITSFEYFSFFINNSTIFTL